MGLDNEDIRSMINQKLSSFKLDYRSIAALIDNSSDYIIFLNSYRQIIRTSSSFKKMIGYSDDELAIFSFENIVHPDDVEGFARRYDDMVTGSVLQPQLITSSFITKSGDYIPLEFNFTKTIVIEGYLMLIARPVELREQQEFRGQSKPAMILTTFLGNPNQQSMTSSGNWWNIFPDMDLRDIAITSTDTAVWQCDLREGDSRKGKVLMDWHMHSVQVENLTCIDGSLIMQIEKKKWWYSIFGINKNDITHYDTVVVRAGEHIKIPVKIYHRVIGDGKSCKYLVLWNPKKFL